MVSRTAIMRNKRKLLGLCVQCGKNPPKPTCTKCYNCLNLQSSYKKHKRQKAKANGICVVSGCTTYAVSGKTMCQNCLTILSTRNAAHYKARAEQGLCECGKIRDTNNKHCSACLVRTRELERNAKLKVFIYYSGGTPHCACCGETTITFLQIDHINNDGNKHRSVLCSHNGGGGPKTYRWLIRNHFPPGFQVLCANCNIGRYLNGGICPHKITGI